MSLNTILFTHINHAPPIPWNNALRFYIDRTGNLDAFKAYLDDMTVNAHLCVPRRKLVSWAEAGSLRALWRRFNKILQAEGGFKALSFETFTGFLEWYNKNHSAYPNSIVKRRKTIVYRRTRKWLDFKLVRMGRPRVDIPGPLHVNLTTLELRVLTALCVDTEDEKEDIQALREAAISPATLRNVADWVLYYPDAFEEILVSLDNGRAINIETLVENQVVPGKRTHSAMRVCTKNGPVPLTRPASVVYDEDFPGFYEE